ncbi:MAG: TIGR00282 family metallophosphoesterase [Opitutaceae bacterium]|nr:TIGR00282 family metallophosphoesterase [Verrucomicrobiales bacterium]
MRIFFIGDIFASAGRSIVGEHCQRIITEERVDLVIANGENAAGGFGISPNISEELFSYGVDVITSGNHVWDKREIYDYMVREPRVLRPANYAPELPGKGIYTARGRNGVQCAVLNLQGRVHMPPTDCPFRKADELLAGIDENIKVRFVDFHAEVTSEKMAMGWHLDGRVSAMVGTHTHIPTADTRILPKGTGYQTDCGMTGPYDSVIGVEKDAVLRKFQTSLPVRFEAAREMVELHGVMVDVEESSGKATAIRRIEIRR